MTASRNRLFISHGLRKLNNRAEEVGAIPSPLSEGAEGGVRG